MKKSVYVYGKVPFLQNIHTKTDGLWYDGKNPSKKEGGDGMKLWGGKGRRKPSPKKAERETEPFEIDWEQVWEREEQEKRRRRRLARLQEIGCSQEEFERLVNQRKTNGKRNIRKK